MGAFSEAEMPTLWRNLTALALTDSEKHHLGTTYPSWRRPRPKENSPVRPPHPPAGGPWGGHTQFSLVCQAWMQPCKGPIPAQPVLGREPQAAQMTMCYLNPAVTVGALKADLHVHPSAQEVLLSPSLQAPRAVLGPLSHTCSRERRNNFPIVC